MKIKDKVEAFEDLKPKQQAKAIKNRSSNKNNQSKATIIFNNLIKKKTKSNELYELHDSDDMN